MLLRAEIERDGLVELEGGTSPPSVQYDQTSYNLRLGRQYCLVSGSHQKQEIGDCSTGMGVLRLPPFACALVGSEELVRLPADVTARWGLKIRPAMSGLVFQAGPQIEPGSHGRLFGLLFNLSSSERTLPYLTTLWSIDFERLPVPSAKPLAPGAPVVSMLRYTQMGLPTGSINEIYAEYRILQRDTSARREISIAVILAIVALLAGTLLPTVVSRITSESDGQRQRIEQLEIDVAKLEGQLNGGATTTSSPTTAQSSTTGPTASSSSSP